MAKLDDLLAQAQSTNVDMKAIAQQGGGGSSDMVRLRTKFATLMADAVAAMHQDERLKANPPVRREFETKFFNFRQRLAQHQAEWRMSEVAKDPEGYKKSVEEVNTLQGEFYDFANSELPKL